MANNAGLEARVRKLLVDNIKDGKISVSCYKTLHEMMWNWIARHPGVFYKMWPGWKPYREYRTVFRTDRFACAVYNDDFEGDNCHNCGCFGICRVTKEFEKWRFCKDVKESCELAYTISKGWK